ncbi:YsnF/AvaK domain-containing protein [Bacillus atrophaeus]|uniref:YsnF/AvaK domain-containing protein n=1 Tax=Bacillus atrophaeus TaxID=1452 RepID=UPI0022826196|nr:YsnF/AvaK domain-containing protein [Bacillus atrophaeus]MCY9107189.1 YsnF/AvaK domain-containing protein [Bacillus atrophaeus]MEC1899719.1 YsnF/AvaK domain-containing protein [Bacillus atrophaeus]MEC2395578.1 YsnF/AvaK domain-containing protein [Bacillus atrophaeus]MED4435211.1 YsnF/AvaK domain-containing protein [Bacillus atrophaeus]MED4564960.1 YsnF/AvaK domain-containing protein [Bacillus atrophaeus]
MTKSVVGIYETPRETVAAIEGLKTRGYDSDSISVVTNRKDTDYLESQTGTQVKQAADTNDSDSESFFDKLKDYFTMDDSGTNQNKLSDLDIANDDAERYQEELNDGKILLAVDTDAELDNSTNDNEHVLSGGFSNTNEMADYTTKEEKTMPLREEQLKVDKEDIQTGEVEIGKDVKTEQRDMDIPVRHDEIYVERRPVDENTADASPVNDTETVRVPIVEEKLEVTKKPVVTDEVVVGKRTVEENEHISETVKKEEPRLNKEGNVRDLDDDTLNNK